MKVFRLLFLTLLLCPSFAFAQADNCGTVSTTCDQGNAFQLCHAALQDSLTYPQGATIQLGCTAAVQGGVNAYACAVTRNGTWYSDCYQPGTSVGQRHFYWKTSCESRNAGLGGTNQPVRWSNTDQSCVGGCRYKIVSDFQQQHVTTAHTGGYLKGGIWEYDGAVCGGTVAPSNPDPDPAKPDEPQCVPAGDGQSYCQMPNGDKCHTASTGRAICWGANELGTKTDGAVAQVAGYGANPSGPSVPPPPGATFNPGPSTTVNHTTNNFTTTTTFTNWTTSSGGPAGPGNQGSNTGPGGVPTTGTGGTGTCDPSKGPCGNTASGGETCGAPPITGGDPLLGMVAKQAWQTRCAVEGSVGADGGCGAPAPACTGSKVLCEIAERERQRKCQEDARLTDFNASLAADAEADDGTENISVDDIWGDGDLPTTADLSTGLFGGAVSTCPFEYSYGGRPVELPPQFWILASFIRLLLLAAAYIWIAQMLL